MTGLTLDHLLFTNKDAVTKVTDIIVERQAVRHVVTWYAAFHDGDRYKILLNGKPLKLLPSGVLSHPFIRFDEDGANTDPKQTEAK